MVILPIFRIGTTIFQIGPSKVGWPSTQASEIIMSQVGSGNWSDTVWKNTDELKARLDIALQKCMIEGKTAQQIARELRPLVSKEFKNAKYASERLARTESARVQANATLANLKRYGYDYCKWIAEPSACKIRYALVLQIAMMAGAAECTR